MFEALEGSGFSVSPGDWIRRGCAMEQVRKLLGEERAREFEKAPDRFYRTARQALEAWDLPAELADNAWLICRAACQAAERAAQNRALSVEERQRQVEALQMDAERRLNEVLGEKVARPLRRGLGFMLGGLVRHGNP